MDIRGEPDVVNIYKLLTGTMRNNNLMWLMDY